MVLLLVLSSLWSQENDSLKSTDLDSLNSTKSDTSDNRIFSAIKGSRTQVVKIIAWPFENVVEPALSLLIYPMSPPINYVFRKDIINRGLAFSSLGDDDNILLYPTVSIGSGAESSLGVSYIHRTLLMESDDRLKLDVFRTIDNDWYQAGRYDFFGLITKYDNLNVEITKNNFLNVNLFNPPNELDTLWLRSDSSLSLSAQYGVEVVKNWAITGRSSVHYRNYSTLGSYRAEVIPNNISFPAEVREDLDRYNSVVEELQSRGYWSQYRNYSQSLGLIYDKRESQFAATEGARFTLAFSHNHVTEGLGDFQNLSMSYEHYTLLGKKKYDLSQEDHEKNKRYLRNFRLNNAFDFISPEKWRDIYLQRKVLVTYLRYNQSWDVEQNNPAVYNGLNSLGANSPLRAYPSRRFVDYGTLLWSSEYRWPMIRYIDGVFFNEYGWAFRGPHELNPLDYVNSFGFGFRARKADFFIMRLNIGFHGPLFSKTPIEGIAVRITIRPEYN